MGGSGRIGNAFQRHQPSTLYQAACSQKLGTAICRAACVPGEAVPLTGQVAAGVAGVLTSGLRLINRWPLTSITGLTLPSGILMTSGYGRGN